MWKMVFAMVNNYWQPCSCKQANTCDKNIKKLGEVLEHISYNPLLRQHLKCFPYLLSTEMS